MFDQKALLSALAEWEAEWEAEEHDEDEMSPDELAISIYESRMMMLEILRRDFREQNARETFMLELDGLISGCLTAATWTIHSQKAVIIASQP